MTPGPHPPGSTEILALIGYGLVIAAYVGRASSRRGAATIVGYGMLILAKQCEVFGLMQQTRVDTLRRLGYLTLLLSPAYEHLYDVFGLVGYAIAVSGNYDASSTPLALYYILALPTATDDLYYSARAVLGVASALGWKNPLMQ